MSERTNSFVIRAWRAGRTAERRAAQARHVNNWSGGGWNLSALKKDRRRGTGVEQRAGVTIMMVVALVAVLIYALAGAAALGVVVVIGLLALAARSARAHRK